MCTKIDPLKKIKEHDNSPILHCIVQGEVWLNERLVKGALNGNNYNEDSKDDEEEGGSIMGKKEKKEDEKKD